MSVSCDLLRQLWRERRAVIGFSIYNLEQGLGVVRAAEHERVPVLLQAGSSAFRYSGRVPLARLATGLAEDATVPVGVHLDHSTDITEIIACLKLGYTSVMFDGSALSFEENVRVTREVVAIAHAHGAWVEAELAGIAGNEDQTVSVPDVTATTDPELAERFVKQTGVDALAVAVGNVHGVPAEPVQLDLHLLADISDAVRVPLVLHGASGLPEEDVARAISLGVAKLNVNTELRRAFRDAVIGVGATPPAGDSLPALLEPTVSAVKDAAQEKLRACTAARAA